MSLQCPCNKLQFVIQKNTVISNLTSPKFPFPTQSIKWEVFKSGRAEGLFFCVHFLIFASDTQIIIALQMELFISLK